MVTDLKGRSVTATNAIGKAFLGYFLGAVTDVTDVLLIRKKLKNSSSFHVNLENNYNSNIDP